MDSSLEFLHEGIIMDACCVINLYASGQINAILSVIPKTVAISAYVRNHEAHNIYNGPLGKSDVTSPKQKIELQPFIDSGLINVVVPHPGVETEDVVNFGQFIHKGEAYTGAIAKGRNWAIVTDDIDAIAFFIETLRYTQLISTLALIKYWEEQSSAPAKVVSQVLKDIQIKASYTPRSNHSYYSWWLSRIKTQISELDSTESNIK